MPNLRDGVRPPNPSNCLDANRLEEHILQFFAATDIATQAKQEFAAQIDAIAEAFLQSEEVSSEIDLSAIASHFQDSHIPLVPTNLDHYLQEFATQVAAHSIHTASPRYIGHMTSALPHFMYPLSKLMTVLNQNVVKIETAKAFSPYERQALAMLHRLVYKSSESFYEEHIQSSTSTLGILTTGGTLANITALWCARNQALPPQAGFAGVESEGLAAALESYGYKGAVIIGSALMHYSFEKAAGLLGIGDRQLIRIPTDAQHRIELSVLRQTIRECQAKKQLILAVVGVAGTTDSGSIDPLEEMAAIAQELGIHFHVDAAWGGPALFSEQYRHRLAGIELADSVTIDGHKQLYLPMGLGMVLFRNPHLAQAIEKTATYTVRKDSPDLGKRALEGSRSGMVILLQAALKLLSQQGYAYLIDSGIQKARYMAAQIEQMTEFELLLDPDMNLLLYRYIPEPFRQKLTTGQLSTSDQQSINYFNELLQNAQSQAGKTFVSRTTLTASRYGTLPIVALRVVLANPLTTEADIDAVLADQRHIASKLPVVACTPAEASV